MYSAFQNEDIRILDKKKLKKYAESKAKDNDVWNSFVKEHYSFKAFDEWKIQGYWYENWCRFLVEVAEFIEGEAHFLYEDGQPFFMEFSKGEVEVHFVPLEWVTMSYAEIEKYAKIPTEVIVAKRL